jgi:hypothetical protein
VMATSPEKKEPMENPHLMTLQSTEGVQKDGMKFWMSGHRSCPAHKREIVPVAAIRQGKGTPRTARPSATSNTGTAGGWPQE